MIDLLGPSGSITMNDVLVTAGAVLAGWVKYAQKAKDDQLSEKDRQIASMQKHIDWQEKELDKWRDKESIDGR